MMAELMFATPREASRSTMVQKVDNNLNKDKEERKLTN